MLSDLSRFKDTARTDRRIADRTPQRERETKSLQAEKADLGLYATCESSTNIVNAYERRSPY